VASAFLLLTLAGCSPQATSPSPPPSLAGSSPGPSAAADQRPACTQIGQTWVSPIDGVTLVCVPAASFQMGAADDDPGAAPDSKPRHLVRLSAFWIDRTEVTNADYQKCVVAQVCRAPSTVPGSTTTASKTHPDYYHEPAFAHYPVLVYTPEEAVAYCTCMKRRLPTEAEFELAAGGTDGRTYPWGDTLDCAHASYLGCTTDTTDVETPLAGASPYGALNMAGNVWEWLADRYSADYYAESPVQDPTGPATGDYTSRRGGGFSSLPRQLVVTVRANGDPVHYFDGQMGFRCAASASPP
jgi:formylglycine-generating enzyme required for sulfatase activity